MRVELKIGGQRGDAPSDGYGPILTRCPVHEWQQTLALELQRFTSWAREGSDVFKVGMRVTLYLEVHLCP